MNNMEKYNLDKLIKVKVFDEKEKPEFKWLPENKSWWYGNREEGVYFRGNTFYGKESLKEFFVKDGLVYLRAKCVLYFQDGYEFTYYCDSLDLAKQRYDIINELFLKQFGRNLIVL